jgi:hypothetical protein
VRISELIAEGRKVIQFSIPAVLCFKLILHPAQLFVPHFQFNLVSAEIVNEVADIMGKELLQPLNLCARHFFFGPLAKGGESVCMSSEGGFFMFSGSAS